MEPTKAPRVFISYSWESEAHKSWVRYLGEKLYHAGIEARLDQWCVRPGESFTAFMEREVEAADFVIVVCTPSYAHKSNNRQGGVGYEQQIVSGRLMAGTARSKFIPILRNGEYEPGSECAIPTHFRGIASIDFRNEALFEETLEDLVRVIFSKPRFGPPPLGIPPPLETVSATLWREGGSTDSENRVTELVQQGHIERGEFEAAIADYSKAIELQKVYDATAKIKRGVPRSPSRILRLLFERIPKSATRTGGLIALSLTSIGILILLFYLIADSQLFELRHIDVRGNSLLSADEVKAMVKPHVPRGVLNANLELIRKKLESNPLIREAEVSRLWLDGLRVKIVERQPIALARRGNSIVCVDDEGVMFGDSAHWRGKTPPVISGLAETGENANEINRRWMMTYKRLMGELDQSKPPLSSRFDEIYFDEDMGVRLKFADRRQVVLIGKEDFRTRLNAALEVLDAVRRKDAEALNRLRIVDTERLLSGATIRYLNATDPKRIIVGLDE